ncbi:transcriptional regulator, partial [Sphingomonas koreensis]
MAATGFRFEGFHLDPGNRRLTRNGAPVELNARYLDALLLLVREPGQLVPKDRFMGEVWRGIPVTDEALTQCIRTLRRQLGDDATSPRFIETVPKHGYRFIAAVRADERIAPPSPLAS